MGSLVQSNAFWRKTLVRRRKDCEEKANILTLILQKLYKSP